MPALSDRLLRATVSHLETVHGEPIVILTGDDAGLTYIGIVETEADLMLGGELLGQDPRGKTTVHFSTAPNIKSQAMVQTADGKRWNAIRQNFSAFLTTDFELKEISSKDT